MMTRALRDRIVGSIRQPPAVCRTMVPTASRPDAWPKRIWRGPDPAGTDPIACATIDPGKAAASAMAPVPAKA